MAPQNGPNDVTRPLMSVPHYTTEFATRMVQYGVNIHETKRLWHESRREVARCVGATQQVRLTEATTLDFIVILVVVVLLARDVIYTSRAYATMPVSVCLSVTEVNWRIIANLGFKFRSKFTAHCRRGRGGVISTTSRAMLATARPSCLCWYCTHFQLTSMAIAAAAAADAPAIEAVIRR